MQVFTVNGIKNENKIIIKPHHDPMAFQTKKITDTKIKRFEVSKSVMGEVLTCNVSSNFLELSKKIPVMYLNVVYERPLRRILLYKVTLLFIMSEEEVVKRKTIPSLIKYPIEGIFTLEISLEDKNKIIDDDIATYPGNDEMCEKLVQFSQTDDMQQFTNDLVTDICTKLEEAYKKEIEDLKPPRNIISLRNYKLD